MAYQFVHKGVVREFDFHAPFATVEEMLQRKLTKLGISRPAIDPDRRFVFGFSAGGMMAYKLAHEMPNYFGALWVMSGAFGGRAHEGLTATVTNDPQGASSVSLFAHHGEADTVVPPGDRQDPTGRWQPDTLFELPSGATIDLYGEAGIPSADAHDQNNSYRPLAAAVEEFRRYNDCEPEPVAPDSGAGKEDVNGGTNARLYIFRQEDGAINPEVTVYRDEEMGHGKFSEVPNPYVDVARTWNWFKDHPRIPL